VLVGGRIWTGDRAQPWVEAVAIAGGRIAQVGNRTAIEALVGPETRVIDLEGRLATPGINDAHIHFLGGALGLDEVDLTGACSLSAMQGRIAEYARNHPERPWIYGRGWEYACFPGGRLPTRADLDAVVADRPVYLRAYDGHTGWANSRAIARAGITARTRVEGFGEIVRDPQTGEPTGVFKESAGRLIGRLIPAPTRTEKLAALRQGMALATRLGITSIQNASGDEEEFSLYEELLNRGELNLRVSMAFSVGGGVDEATIGRWVALKDRYRNHPLLRAGAVKFLMDGVIESHTAAMLAPYSDLPGSRGTPALPFARFAELAARLDRSGFQIFTHAIGDRGVRLTLDGYARVAARNGQADRRARIEHIEVVDPVDIPRFARLGVLASMEPIHADPGTVAVWSKAVGPKRLPRAFAWHDLSAAGAHLVFSSDWPAAISVDPIRGLHNAVNRRTIDGQPPGGWVSAQRVSVEQALAAYTHEGAYASFEESRKGRIKPGQLADLVVFSQDLFRIPPLDIHRTRVVLTVFDGRVIYRDPERFPERQGDQ